MPEKAPTITAIISEPGQRWDGWQVTMRIPEEWGVVEDLAGNNVGAVTQAFVDHLVSWTVTDAEGKPLPITRDGVRKAPRKVIAQAINEMALAMRALPNDLGAS